MVAAASAGAEAPRGGIWLTAGTDALMHSGSPGSSRVPGVFPNPQDEPQPQGPSHRAHGPAPRHKPRFCAPGSGATPPTRSVGERSRAGFPGRAPVGFFPLGRTPPAAPDTGCSGQARAAMVRGARRAPAARPSQLGPGAAGAKARVSRSSGTPAAPGADVSQDSHVGRHAA